MSKQHSGPAPRVRPPNTDRPPLTQPLSQNIITLPQLEIRFYHNAKVQYKQAHMTIKEIAELQLIPVNIQRPQNFDTINQYYGNQLQIIELFGTCIVPGSFLINHRQDGRYELLDGQHRWCMCERLAIEQPNLSEAIIPVLMFHCLNSDQINAIYSLANQNYTHNGNIDPNTKQVFPTALKTNEIITELKANFNEFKHQTKERKDSTKKIIAPHFDINDLTRELNSNALVPIYSTPDIVKRIIQANETCRAKVTAEQQKRCEDGFYLPYMATKCAWISKILK